MSAMRQGDVGRADAKKIVVPPVGAALAHGSCLLCDAEFSTLVISCSGGNVVKIRKACMADARAIQKVAYVLRLPGIAWCDWHTLAVIRETINKNAYYVAEIDDVVVGAMSLVRHRGMVEIGTLAVRRSCHGRGIGKKLVRFACSFGRRRWNARRITVGSFVAYGAKPFYLSVGFRVKSFGLYRGRKWYEFVAALQ